MSGQPCWGCPTAAEGPSAQLHDLYRWTPPQRSAGVAGWTVSIRRTPRPLPEVDPVCRQQVEHHRRAVCRADGGNLHISVGDSADGADEILVRLESCRGEHVTGLQLAGLQLADYWCHVCSVAYCCGCSIVLSARCACAVCRYNTVMSTTVQTADQFPAAWGYVLANDRFMSGWGHATGVTNVVVLPVTSGEADSVAARLDSRDEMAYVRVVRNPPRLRSDRMYSLFDRDDASYWYGTSK